MEPLSDDWVKALVSASAQAADDQVGSRSGAVEFAVGKSERAVVAMVDGRFVDPDDKTDDEVDLSIPITAEQLQAFLSGEESMAEAYIRGDLKPVGSTGLFLSLVELVESGALKSLA